MPAEFHFKSGGIFNVLDGTEDDAMFAKDFQKLLEDDQRDNEFKMVVKMETTMSNKLQ